MKFTGFLSLALAGGLLFTSCNKEDGLDGDPTVKQKGEVTKATIVLVDSPVAYAAGDDSEAGTAAENKINQIEFYIFDSVDGERDTENGGYVKSTFTEGYKGNGITFSLTSGSKTILVACNMDLGPQTGKDLDAVRKIMTGITLPGSNPRAIPANGIPMAGEMAGISVTANVVDENKVTIPVNRLYSKINTPTTAQQVVISVEDAEEIEKLKELFGDDVVITNLKFAFKGYTVINGIKDSYAYINYNTNNNEEEAWTNWDLNTSLSNYHKATYDTDGQIVSIYSGKKGNDFWLGDSNDDLVFVYENTPSTYTENNVELFTKETVYAMLIKGELTDPVTNKTETRYWRLNLAKGQVYNIWRNAVYYTNITKITSAGYETPEEGDGGGGVIPVPNQTGIIATIKVNDWRVFTNDAEI